MQTTQRDCEVYWIKLPEHTDMVREGYIGITTLGVAKRYNLHKSVAAAGKNQSVIARAIRKYGDNLKIVPLLVGSEDYCRMIEFKLRPVPSVGWNIGVGGSGTRSGQRNSDEHIAKFRLATTGRKRSTAVVEKFRQNGLAQMSFANPWEHPYSKEQVWLQAEHACELTRQGAGQRTIALQFGVGRDSVVKLVAKLKAGWNPVDDEDYQLWKSSQLQIKESNG